MVGAENIRNIDLTISLFLVKRKRVIRKILILSLAYVCNFGYLFTIILICLYKACVYLKHYKGTQDVCSEITPLASEYVCVAELLVRLATNI